MAHTREVSPHSGGTFILYGKMGTMKRFMPVGGDAFVQNLIYAGMFSPKNQTDVDAMLRDLAFVRTQGTFHFRKVS